MARVILPTEAEWQVLQDLGLLDGEDAVLLSPAAAQAAAARGLSEHDLEDAALDYAFGGEPDLRADVVYGAEHFFFDALPVQD